MLGLFRKYLASVLGDVDVVLKWLLKLSLGEFEMILRSCWGLFNNCLENALLVSLKWLRNDVKRLWGDCEVILSEVGVDLSWFLSD